MARQEKWEILLPDRQTIQKILLLWQHQISSLPTSKIVFWHLYFFRGEDNTERKASKCLMFSFPWITSQTPCKRVHDRWLGFLWRTLLVIFVNSFLSPLKMGFTLRRQLVTLHLAACSTFWGVIQFNLFFLILSHHFEALSFLWWSKNKGTLLAIRK